MRKIFKKLLVPVMGLGLSFALWSCTKKVDSKIIFDSNEGSPIVESTTTVDTEPVPTKKGYTFEGWYTTVDFTDERVQFPFELGKEDITLYAKWKLETYTITYHLNGGTNHASNPASYTVEDTVTFNNPTNGEKKFEGWYKESTFQTAVTGIAKGNTGNMDLYAKWKEEAVVSTYSITYHLDGGANPNTNPASYKKGDSISLADATKNGYTFEGWYADSTFKNKVTSIDQNTTGDLNLYAKFTADTYSITYHLDDGVNHKDNPTSYTIVDTVSLKDATKTGYNFEGWYTDSHYETKVTEIALGSTGNVDLYAKFTSNAYSITYHLDDGVNHNDNPANYTVFDIVSLKDATKTGYTFGGWYTDSNYETKITQIALGSKGNLDLYAKFDPTAYTITYHLDGGMNHKDNPASYTVLDTVTLKDPTKDHMTFDGWYTDSEYETKVTAIDLGSTGNVDLYAKFIADTYTITYHLDDGVNHEDNPTSYTVLDTVVLKDPTKDHMSFRGWYTDSKYETKVTEIALGSYGNLDLYAKWAKIDYTFTYHLDGGTNASANPSGYAEGEAFALEDPSKLGYTFEGWYSDAAYSTQVTEITADSKGNKDFYAKFEIENYQLAYNLNGGTNHENNPATYTVEDAFTLEAATKTGYTFDGWYTESTFENKLTEITAGTTGTKELYAKFVNNYDLMYGTWSKDGYALFLELTSDHMIYNAQSYPYTMNDFTSSAITAGNDEISFAYQPEEETLKVSRKYFRSPDDLDRTTEEFTLTKIELADTRAYAGTYYTGQSRVTKDLIIDAYGHVTRFDGADTYQGFITINDTSVVIQYKTNNIGDWITCNGTLENGVLTLTKDDTTVIYVKNDKPAVYYSDNNIALYKYSSINVIEIENVDYLATMTGEFIVDNLVTFAYGAETITFRVKTLAGASWGNLESAKAHAGEYTFADSEDILVLDGFGPTNGMFGKAMLNGEAIQYSMLGYMEHMVLVHTDGTERYYSMTDRVLTEITTRDGMEGVYESGSSFYQISGLGYYGKSNSSYYDTYTYDPLNKTITLNGTEYSIYHDGNVLSNGSSHYIKDSYSVETMDFTDYLSKTYVNTDSGIKLKITKTEDLYQVVIIEAFTLNGTEFSGTYDAVYVLDRLVFNGVELVLSDTLDLVVSPNDSYALIEFVPEKTLAEKVVGLYVNGGYYVRVYADGADLKVYYGGNPNPYSDPTAYDCTIVDEETKQLQFVYSSYTNAFVFSDANGKEISFASDSTVEYSYRGKVFAEYDDSTVELVGKNYQAKAGSNPSASSLAEIYENGAKKSWSNIKFETPLTDGQKNVPGSYEADVYAWVYGVKRVATVSYTVIENYALSKSNKSIYVQENYGKAEIIASGMFTAKHNGVNDTVTEDMITLPAGYDSTVVGAYTITCTYYTETVTATLNINPDPTGEYVYLSGETNTSYGTYFSSGIKIEVVNGSTNLIIDSNTITGIESGNNYSINGKDITVKLLTNGNLTLTYTDSRWNEYTTTYAKPKEVDLSKYCGVYTYSSYNIRLYEDSKKLKFVYGSSANPYSDPTSYECTIVNEEAGTIQFTNGSYVNIFTFTDNAGVKTLTFGSDSSIEYNYRGRVWTSYDDSTVELVGKNYQAKAGSNPSASSLAEIHENGEKKSWSNIKFVTPLTDAQKNTLGEHTAEVYAWVYGKKIVATVSYTVIENYSLSRSNKTIFVQAGYGKAEIIASGMFTAKHNGVADTITEDMITLPDGFDSSVAGTYTITCTYHTETVTATLTVNPDPAGQYVYLSGETNTYYGTYFENGITIEVVNGSINLIIDSNKIENIKSGYSYQINGKDITVGLLTNGNLTLTYTDNNWNDHTTTYTKQS